MCIHDLQKEHSIIDDMIGDLARISPPSPSPTQGWQQERDQGALLRTELWGRLEVLRFLLEQSDVVLGVEQVGRLWEALEANEEARVRWLRLVCEAGKLMSREAEEQVSV